MRKLLLGSVAIVALAIPAAANAADLPAKAPPYTPAYVPTFTWTGLYLGVHGGCGAARHSTSPAPFTDVDPGEAGVFFESLRADSGGCFAGGQIGYNWQFASNWVFGIEADAAWASIKGKSSINEVEPTEIETLALLQHKVTAFGTVRGRLGYATSWGTAPVLTYVTGGWAWARNELFSRPAEGVAGVLPGALTDTQTHFGWTIGGGIEAMLGRNWSLKGEYLYMDLGSKTYATGLITDDGVLPGATAARVDLKIHTVKVGLNYKFDWGGPVVARY